MAEKIQVSRIQNRRGLRKDLPQPLYAGEFGYCIDTGQLFIGSSSNHLEEIILGSELFQPAPLNGVAIANQLKNRVFFCDTEPFTKDAEDAVSPDDIIEALEAQIYKECVYEDINTDSDYRDANLGERDFSSTVRYQVLEDDIETGMIKWRFQIGVYMHEVKDQNGIRRVIDADIVRSNIIQSTIANELGEDTPIFNNEEYNISSIVVNYNPQTLKLTNASFKNNEKLTLDEYSGLSWCINQIYILNEEESPGLVTVIGNVELVTEISLFDLLPNDFRDTFEYDATLVQSSTGNADVDGLELSLGDEGENGVSYRSFDLDYSLVYFVNVSGEKERYSATGNISITVKYDNSTPSLSFTDTFTQTTPPSGEFAWIPYIKKQDNKPDVVGFKYKNTINDNTEVLDQNNNATYPYRGASMELRVYSVQWANF